MSKRPTAFTLTQEDRSTLEAWVRAGKTERRLADRARIILLAAEGAGTIPIARSLRMRAARVSKWRVRFAGHGLHGLQDAPRPGAVRRYDETTEKRILARLDEPPPSGYATWSGALLAHSLGDVHASWLNQIECWFSILSRRALRGASFTSPGEVREAIHRFIAAYNKNAAPFAWTKRDVRNVHPQPYYANLRN